MVDARPLTLLELATVASRAVVPVLLAVLLVVADRRADTLPSSTGSERHVSVRQVAALKTFELGIVRRDRVKIGTLSGDALVERIPQCAAAWEGRSGVLDRVQSFLSHASDHGETPATRIAARLQEIDRALLRFSSMENARVSEKLGLDGERWANAVAAVLQAPIESTEYPGHRFRVQCSDIAAAVFALSRSDGRMLATLAWRGTEVDRVTARWRPDQFVEVSPRQIARANPWAGIPGCIYFGHSSRSGAPLYYLGGVRGLDDHLCERDDMRGTDGDGSVLRRVAGEPSPDMPPDDERWKVPPSLATMLQPLESLHRPDGSLYRMYASATASTDDATEGHRPGTNRIRIGGAPVDVGLSIDVTIDPALQALAQQTAACYTGRADICQALGMTRREDGNGAVGHRMLERAMVRMAAIAIIDVDSGRIEALAGALSPCTRQEFDGPGRASSCDKRIPYPIRYRPDALLNAAAFQDAMPASTIKPIMAAAFLTDPVVGARWLASETAEMARSPRAVPRTQSLRGQLMRSDSARFLDRMFCADTGFGPCERAWEIQRAAAWFGWNRDCAIARDDCGKRDLLLGRPLDATGGDELLSLALTIPYGRLLTEPVAGKLGAPSQLRPSTAIDRDKLRRCAAGPDGKWPSRDDWEKCRGGIVVDVVAEGWGQGQARASALGGAGMMAMLAAAANGTANVPVPHLVDALHGPGPAEGTSKPLAARWNVEERSPGHIPREVAEVILSGLSFGHRAGTSRRACEQVFDAKACTEIDWIAGKTGTPTFPNDDRSLDQLARLCTAPTVKVRRDRDACGPLRPYKWYVAAYRADPDSPRWTKAIGVLTERNWWADTGRIHGAGDHGPNPAAEIAMQIAGRDVGALPWSGH
jgi:hypothetical protein